MIRALLFDLDETLVNRRETMRVFLTEQHHYFKLEFYCSAEKFSESCLFHQCNGYASKEVAYSKASNELGIPTKTVSALLKNYKDHYGKKAFAFPGSVETIAQLALNFPLGLVSNGTTRGQMGKLHHTGLLPYFDSILISESFGVKKPDPTIFLACLQELGVHPNEALFIGDHPDADIQPALSLGMKAIWVQNNNFPPPTKCHGQVKGVSELPELLPSLAS
jgi:putative hydrolase of the HAD superfamily